MRVVSVSCVSLSRACRNYVKQNLDDSGSTQRLDTAELWHSKTECHWLPATPGPPHGGADRDSHGACDTEAGGDAAAHA